MFSFPHYDLVPGKRKMALEFGAVAKNLREFLMERHEGRAVVEGGNELRQASLF